MALNDQKIGLEPLKKRYKVWWIAGIAGVIVMLAIITFISLFTWYKSALTPRDSKTGHKVRIEINSGDTTPDIARKLQKAGVIKSAVAFEWYMRLERPQSTLQAGTYALSPKSSVQNIVNHIEGGKTDLFMITILPGSTLEEIEKTLIGYGYTKTEVEKAFKATYTQPLLADRPKGASLEGYIFPETFEVYANDSLESLFIRDFTALYARLEKDGLIDKFKARGLNLHQAFTMASIVQKEASSPEDQLKVAQVFYTRLSMNMKLETDPTFIYAAKMMGVEPRVDIDSPYNTRLYPGLPPGPIGNMEYSALQAVADPATTDYVYFVAGDDGTTHFSHTLAEHEENTQKYCHKLCQ